MSVTGLDSPAVVEAYRGSLADPGGWLLLQYKSRDEVDVLNRGNGGWQDMRTALDSYEEKSPLYGFFLYRRRKVVLKYIPEETSRLLQVRTTVHFPAVLDHFSPHDATLSASTPTDVTDSTLATACSLEIDTSMGSNEGSPRRRNLSEISEDVEMPQSSNPEVTSILARLKANKEALLREQNESGRRESTIASVIDEEELSYPRRPNLPAAGGTSLISVFDRSLHPRVTPKDPRSNQSVMERRFIPDLREGRKSPTMSRKELRDARARKKPEFVHNARAESPHLYPRSPRKTNDGLRADLFDSRKNASNVRADIFDPRRNAENSRIALPDARSNFYESRLERQIQTGEEALKRPATENSARQKLPSGMRIALQRGDNAPKLPKTEGPVETPRLPSIAMSNNILNSTSIITAPPAEPSYVEQGVEDKIAEDEVAQKREPNVVAGNQNPPDTVLPPATPVNALVEPVTLASKSSQSSIRKTNVAPEKQRLLKALQIRNKQLNKDTIEPNAAFETPTKDGDEATQIMTEDDILKADSGVELESGGNKVNVYDLLPSTGSQDRQQRSNMKVPSEESNHATKIIGDAKEKAYLTEAHATAGVLPAKDPAKKRRTLVKSINTSPHLGDESDGFASDDSLMDELQHATVEQARRISIPGLGSDSNPVSPAYSVGDSKSVLASAKPIIYRNGSMSSAQGTNQEPILVNQAFSPASSMAPEKSSASKPEIPSSAFSRRIKELAEISNREQSNSSGYRQTSASNPTQEVNRGDQSAHYPQSTSQKPQTRAPDSNPQPFSTTTRIVQSNGSNIQANPQPQNAGSTGLQRSEITSQREADIPPRSPSKASFHRVERPSSSASKAESRDSATSSRTKRSADHGFSFLGFRKSGESKPPSRSRRSPSIGTLETVEEDAGGKAKSKKSSILKRMSGFASGSSRKTPTSTIPSYSGGDSSSIRTQLSNSNGFIVGDLNVQFPDTLLWKRRWVEVEHSGFLTLSSTNSHERMRVPPRRYHMSELKLPVVASQDGQELPFSILVDLVNGGTLQFACEDPVSQSQVLRRLSDTHNAWTLYGT